VGQQSLQGRVESESESESESVGSSNGNGNGNGNGNSNNALASWLACSNFSLVSQTFNSSEVGGWASWRTAVRSWRTEKNHPGFFGGPLGTNTSFVSLTGMRAELVFEPALNITRMFLRQTVPRY
jgi:hypothetical protein